MTGLTSMAKFSASLVLLCVVGIAAFGYNRSTREKQARQHHETYAALREAQIELSKEESAKLYAVGAHLQAT